MSEGNGLPKGWVEARIDAFATTATGGTPSRSNPHYFGGAIPWVKSGELGDGRVYQSEETLSDAGLQESNAKLFPAGTLCIALYGATVGKLGILEVEATTNQAVCGLFLPPEVLRRYLFHLLLSIRSRLVEQGKGGAQPNISNGLVRETVVPIAPYPEQHRIVEKIEELFSDLDAGVASLERAKANLKRYRASVLKSAVEGSLTAEWRKEHPQAEDALGQIERTPAPPLPNRWSTRSKDIIPGHGALAVGNPQTAVPDSWTWTPLVRIARMETGHTPSRKHPEWWGGDVPWISISDARRHDGGMICDTEEHTNSEGLANSASRLLPKGTVCISRTASVGYVVVMGTDMATSQDFVNWVPSACVLSDWLRVVFMADRNALLRFGKGTVHKTIYFPEWLSTHIALPPLAEQEEIVALVEERLSQIDSAVKTIDAELIRSKRLRQSILKRAFEGKLVPQDPNDEPASVLLERIKRSREAEQPKKKSKKAKVRPK